MLHQFHVGRQLQTLVGKKFGRNIFDKVMA
jgi:hypothetical protein